VYKTEPCSIAVSVADTAFLCFLLLAVELHFCALLCRTVGQPAKSLKLCAICGASQMRWQLVLEGASCNRLARGCFLSSFALSVLADTLGSLQF
jgi:hypothetical protein